jgi:hypothetical protein
MIAVVVLIFIGLIISGIWQTVRKPAPDERPECSMCRTTKRTLQWMRSWEDWYCWPCKERCIHAIVDILAGEHA